jgi:hypothetical protein
MLYRYNSPDMGMRVVIFHPEVIVIEIKNGSDRWIQVYLREGPWCAFKLQLYLFRMVEVDMGVPQCMDEFSCLKPGDLCHHHHQEGVGGNVERDPQEYIRASLI